MPEYAIRSEDVTPLLKGLSLFGTGGGGSPAFGRAIITNDLARGREYRVVSPDEVPDEALVVSGGIMGSVKVLDRFSPEEIVAQWEKRFELIVALRAMEDYLGRRVDYLVPFELGALNTPVILSLGARAGIPVVDGDGLGRAAPETQMTSFAGYGISVVPMPLVDWEGNVVIVKEASSLFFPDELGRFVVTRAGGLGANAHYSMSGRIFRQVVIPHTLSFALSLGRHVGSLSDPDAVATAVAEEIGGRIAFLGVVKGIRDEETMGFLVQTVTIEGQGDYTSSSLEVLIKNEFMMAIKDGKVGCVFPDLILMIDENGNGIMSSELTVGQRVWVVIAPCHPRLRAAAQTLEGKEALSAARFGQPNVLYRPVESLSRSWRLAW